MTTGLSEEVVKLSRIPTTLYFYFVVIACRNCVTTSHIHSGGDDSVTVSSAETCDADVLMTPQQGHEAKVGVSRDWGNQSSGVMSPTAVVLYANAI